MNFYIQTRNAIESYKLAGYKGDNLNIMETKKLYKLKDYIKTRIEESDLSRTATLEDVSIYWT